MTYIKMTQSRKVCEDGFIIKQLIEGSVYDLRESAARDCFRQGWGVKPSQSEIDEYEQKKHDVASVLSDFGDSYLGMLNSIGS